VDHKDRTSGLWDVAAQVLERARRLAHNPAEAVEALGEARRVAEELVKLGLDLVWPARTKERCGCHCDCDDSAPPGGHEHQATPGDCGDPASSAGLDSEPRGPSDAPPASDEPSPAGSDQLYKVLRVLHDEARGQGRYLTAREIAEAAEASGFKILAGNVRKILRTRAAKHVDSRVRKSDTGRATEYRLASRGRQWFERTYPVH
jgi:hypothetical protein